MPDHVAHGFPGSFFHFSRNVVRKREGKKPAWCVWQAGSRILNKKNLNPLEKLECKVQISFIFIFQTIYKLASPFRFSLFLNVLFITPSVVAKEKQCPWQCCFQYKHTLDDFVFVNLFVFALWNYLPFAHHVLQILCSNNYMQQPLLSSQWRFDSLCLLNESLHWDFGTHFSSPSILIIQLRSLQHMVLFS